MMKSSSVESSFHLLLEDFQGRSFHQPGIVNENVQYPLFVIQKKLVSHRGLLPDPNPRVPKYCRVSGRVSG